VAREENEIVLAYYIIDEIDKFNLFIILSKGEYGLKPTPHVEVVHTKSYLWFWFRSKIILLKN
jgi:hypothetical protein